MSRIKTHIYLTFLITLVFVLLVFTHLWYSTIGLTATYYHPVNPNQVLTTRTDHSIHFPTLLKLRQPYWQHWTISRHGFPENKIQPLVKWTGLLKLNHDTNVQVVGAKHIRLIIDGQPVATNSATTMAAGTHPINISYQYSSESDQVLLSLSQKSNTSRHLITTAPTTINPLNAAFHLYPNRTSLTLRSQLQIAFSLGLIILILSIIYLFKSSKLSSFLTIANQHRYKIVLVCLMVSGLLLRLHQYDLIPPLHETQDEQGLAWHGISLLTTGTPVSWLFADYFNPRPLYPPNQLFTTHWFGADFALGFPYFDNPPFFPLVIGFVSLLGGTTTMFDSKLHLIRLAPILLSTLNIYLLYLFTRLIYTHHRLALLASFFYTFTPLIIVSNRVTKEESLLTTLFLLTGILLHQLLLSPKTKRTIFLLATLCGLALFTKETSIVLPLTTITFLYCHKRLKALKQFIIWYLIYVILYLSYGLPWGWHYQLLSFQVNSHKILNLSSWLSFITDRQGAISNSFSFFFYPLLLLHFFTHSHKLDRFSSTLSTLYFILMGALIYGTTWGFFGWYKIVLYPLLCLGPAFTTNALLNATQKPHPSKQPLTHSHLLRFLFLLLTLIAPLYYPLHYFNLLDSKPIIYLITLFSLLYVYFPSLSHRLQLTYLLLASFAILSTITILFQETLYFTYPTF